jgi:hypothetical protein
MGELTEVGKAGINSLRNEGLRELLTRASYFGYSRAVQKLHEMSGKSERGDPVYSKDWDALIVLDACRYDLMEEVEDDFDFFESGFDSFYSWAGASDEWMRKNFSDDFSDEMAETVMVTGNGFSEDHLEADDFHYLEESWRYAWDSEYETIMPRPITDAGIRLHRQLEPERMIVHYMQPHYPFLSNPDLGCGVNPDEWGEVDDSKDVWDEILVGNVDRETAWQHYRKNLETVLEDVKLLTENIDAEKTVITADHGNALGRKNTEDFWIHGHERKINIEPLRKVPWVETSSVDEESYKPPERPQKADQSKEEMLKALGYL